MQKFMLTLALGVLTAASAQTADMAKPFSFQDGTAKFEGCVIDEYGNYVTCYWNYVRTAAGEADMRLNVRNEIALYSVKGSEKNFFGYGIGETPSGGTVI